MRVIYLLGCSAGGYACARSLSGTWCHTSFLVFFCLHFSNYSSKISLFVQPFSWLHFVCITDVTLHAVSMLHLPVFGSHNYWCIKHALLMILLISLRCLYCRRSYILFKLQMKTHLSGLLFDHDNKSDSRCYV